MKSTAAIYAPANGATPISDALSIISELFHLAGSRKFFSDQELAEAANNSAYGARAGDYISDRLNVFKQPKKDRTAFGYSIYFHYLQFNICNTSPANVHQVR